MILPGLDELDIILLSIFLVFLLIQFVYYIFPYNKINTLTKSLTKGRVSFEEELPPVSVILYADKESPNLKKNLSLLLEQDYPDFEVIVISDGITLETDEVFAAMERTYSNFYHTFVPEGSKYVSRRKLGLTMGIKASKYDWLVFTESYCFPDGKEWLKTMARNFTPDTDIVLGYSGYQKKTGISALRINFENLFSVLRYLGFALMRKPYMADGRNMAYRKSLFFENKGYSSFLNIKKGEDDLFINEVANHKNTRVELAREAQVWIEPNSMKKHWKEEWISHHFNSQYYKGSQKYWLGFETFSRICFYLIWILLILKSVLSLNWILLGISILFFMLRYLFQIIIINKTAQVLQEKKYYLSLPVWDIIWVVDTFRYKLLRMLRNKSEFMCK